MLDAFIRGTHPSQTMVETPTMSTDTQTPTIEVPSTNTTTQDSSSAQLRVEFPIITTSIANDIDGTNSSEAIRFLIEAGIVNNSEHFEPNRPMTRAEFIKILVGFYEMGDDESISLPFSDITSENQVPYIAFALKHGLITPQETFRPNDPITE